LEPKGRIRVSHFYKDIPDPHLHGKFHRCGFKNVDLQPRVSQKIANLWYIANFWYKFAPKGHIPLNNFFTKFGMGEGVLHPHRYAKFHSCVFENVG